MQTGPLQTLHYVAALSDATPGLIPINKSNAVLNTRGSLMAAVTAVLE